MNSQTLLIRQLRRRIRYLSRENERLRRLCGVSEDTDTKNELMALHLKDSHAVMSCTSYPQYIYSTLRGSSLYRVWMRLLTYFRRFRLASAILRISTSLVTIIETSALLLVAATVFVIVLPALLLMTVIISITSLICGIRLNRRLSETLGGKRIYVFLPPAQGEVKPRSVLHATLSQLASDPQNAVFAISPHYFSSKFIEDSTHFFIFKQTPEGVCCIRKYYFFLLRRSVLDKTDTPVRYIF